MTVLSQQVRYTIDGIEVTTYAYYPMGIMAVDEFPTLRGDNPLRSGRNGRAYETKVRDSRRWKLQLKINPLNAAGTRDQSTDPKQVRVNLDALYTALATPGQHTVVRYMPDASTRTAMCEVANVVDIQDPGGYGKLNILTIEFDQADPAWYGTAVTPSATTINASPKAISITNAGTIATSRLAFSCVGPLTDVAIANATTGERLQVIQVVASAKILAIDCDTGVVTYDGTAIPSLVTHTGGVGLMTLAAGANSLSVTSSVTSTGTVQPQHYPSFI